MNKKYKTRTLSACFVLFKYCFMILERFLFKALPSAIINY